MNSTVSRFLVIFVSVCTGGSLFAQGDGEAEEFSPPTHPKALDEVEILEYEGKDLSPVEGSFRENSIAGPQYVDVETYRLAIDGLVDSPKELTYAGTVAFDSYEKVVTLNCVEGWSATILWEGVLVRDLLAAAEADRSAAVVIFHAADGYTTSLPLDHFYENDIIMAYRMNGLTMPFERGFPFQLVAEEKWGYKWIKWIVKIEVSDDESYRGFWESRGYSNYAGYDTPFFD
jgi:DMSO/TMAO reductase YedYZ molybdopterin-dependent catalytic subunit